MTKEALTLALEALEYEAKAYAIHNELQIPKTIRYAITAIKEALQEHALQALHDENERLGLYKGVYEEEPQHPVHISVDVTKEGTAVTAFYRKPDSVMEMFYSQFHPLAQPEHEPVAYIHRNEYNEYRLEPHDNFDIKSIPFNVDVSLFKSPQRTWVGLSVFEINDLVDNTEYEDYRGLVERTEDFLKERNT